MPDAKPTTPAAYLAALAPGRKAAVSAIRRVMRESLDPRLAEVIQYGMISYVIPHAIYPPGYHCDPSVPVVVAALASQKSHIGIYLMSLYQDPDEAARFAAEWKATGTKLDMGKSCVRVKGLDGVPVEVLAQTLKRLSIERYLARYEAVLAERGIAHPGKKAVAAGVRTSRPGGAAVEKKSGSKKAAAKEAVAKNASVKRAAAGAAAGKKAAVKATGPARARRRAQP
jgi:hypothetical protein